MTFSSLQTNRNGWRPVAWELRRHQACWSFNKQTGWAAFCDSAGLHSSCSSLWLTVWPGRFEAFYTFKPWARLLRLLRLLGHSHPFTASSKLSRCNQVAMKVNESGWVHGTRIRSRGGSLPRKAAEKNAEDFTTFIADCKMSQASLLENKVKPWLGQRIVSKSTGKHNIASKPAKMDENGRNSLCPTSSDLYNNSAP